MKASRTQAFVGSPVHGLSYFPSTRTLNCPVMLHRWDIGGIPCHISATSSILARSIQRRNNATEGAATKTARRHWGDIAQTKEFLDNAGVQLGIKKYTDWYGITQKEIRQLGGWGLFYHYPSLLDALKVAYPEHSWQQEVFYEARNMPPGYWTDNKNLMKALDRAEKELDIKQPEDWYSIALSQLKEIGLPSSITKSKLVSLLSERYPNHKWEKVYFLRGKFAQQQRLERVVHSLFPGREIIINARKEANLVNPVTGDYLELDVYIPSLNLAFEYQEVHHYTGAQYAYDPLDTYQTRDSMKRELAKTKGLTLVLVPFWWDGKPESLMATVKAVRPELLDKFAIPPTAEAIPTEMPLSGMKKPGYNVTDIGEPTTACFLTKMDTNPTGWWVFEKYDGVRGFWNPLKRAFFSRLGNKLQMPEEVIASMPDDLFLDGELWFGRDNFSEATKLSGRAAPSEIDWGKFKYMVFDVPNDTAATYGDRYAVLEKRLLGKDHKYIELAPREICKDMTHLETMFQDIIDKGGEGVILRDPTRPYEPGRSRGFLKHKKFRDAEAKIIGDVDGGLQWKCMLPNGVTFSAPAGTTEFVKRWSPKVGDIVSFKYRGWLLGSKKPILPTLYRLRNDLTWESVVNNWKEKKPTVTVLPMKRKRKDVRPKGYWADVQNWRNNFIAFAKEKGFDPLVAENWKDVRRNEITKAYGMFRYCKGSFHNALQQSFPELTIHFNKTKRPHNYWRDIKNVRAFFDKFAADKGFDPLDSDNWYTVSLSEMMDKGGRKIKSYHGGFRVALKKAYPEISFDNWPRLGKTDGWGNISNCRKFFDEYAREKDFEPLDVNQWYKDGVCDGLAKKVGGASVQLLHGGYKKALILAYPELNFNKWTDKTKQ